MPSNNPVRRALALPMAGALIFSGLLLGSAAPASSAPAPATTVATASVAATTMSARTLQQRKQIRNRKIERALKAARNQIGDPYVYGADGPNSFDCSGLTQFAFGRADLYLPRTSHGQASHVRRIDKSRMKRGDLMFFYGSGGVYHVGIFVGWRDGQRTILHASRSGTPVKRDPVWTSSWYAGTLRLAS